MGIINALKEKLVKYQKTPCEEATRIFKEYYGDVLNEKQMRRARKIAKECAEGIKAILDPAALKAYEEEGADIEQLYEDDAAPIWASCYYPQVELQSYILGVIECTPPGIIHSCENADNMAFRMARLMLHLALCDAGVIDGVVDWPEPRFDVRRDAIAVKPDAFARLLRDAGYSSVSKSQLHDVHDGFQLSWIDAAKTEGAFAELTAADALHFKDVSIGECFWVESKDGIHRFVKYDEIAGNNACEINSRHYVSFADDVLVKRATVKRISLDGSCHYYTPAEAIKDVGGELGGILGYAAYSWPKIEQTLNCENATWEELDRKKKRIGWAVILAGMDPAVRSYVESESKLPGFSLDTNEAFLTRYLQLAHEDLILG